MSNYDYEKLTPMMRQYLDTKEDYPDSVLMFRMGDFYEMFFDNAVFASKKLNIVLTARDAGVEKKVPMCGVPYHAADSYISKLVNDGYKVAICEQLEDPKESKGLVKRGVTRVITPGTNLDFTEEDSSNNYLGSIFVSNNSYALSYVDYSTGSLYFTFKNEDFNDFSSHLRNQLNILEIKELILNSKNINIDDILKKNNILVNYAENTDKINLDEFLDGKIISVEDNNIILNNQNIKNSLIELISYIDKTQFGALDHIRKIEYINLDNFMSLDNHTLVSLDIISEINNKKEGTLLNLLDKTKTSMGSRKMKFIIEHPLITKEDINKRLEFVNILYNNLINLGEIRNLLNEIYDIERALVRISGVSNSPKDLLLLKNSLNPIDNIIDILNKLNINFGIFNDNKSIEKINEIKNLINDSILENALTSPKEGSIIKDGFSEKLDELKNSSTYSSNFILEYENELKNETGINKLKIKYNKILGYFIEISKSYLDKVPDYFIRKQTLVGSERYFTEKLKSAEMEILNSKDIINQLEYEIYLDIRDIVLDNYDLILNLADDIAMLDVFSTFSKVSYNNDYIRPIFSDANSLEIKNGRHPIVEKNVDIFIDNDTIIDNNKNFIILTGPNMAGKSTYMRQLAIISIMYQIGCFVPASYAKLPIFDKIFTRIGAHDNLYLGESTFMVEMKEMADIIDNATDNSLIILDEVGRGTSTYDGLSLARALIEYIIERINAKTIFATHFHELVRLEENYSNIKNQTMSVSENNGEIKFLRKVIDGTSDRSYGLHVANLAGVKITIIKRAEKYLSLYENNNRDPQINLFSETVMEYDNDPIKENKSSSIIFDKLDEVDPNELTPREALDLVYKLKDILDE